MIQEDFDQTLETNIGRPLYWNLEKHIAAVEQMIMADELQIALKMLENVPGWWRDHYPNVLARIKSTIYRQTYDQVEYATDDEEADCPREMGESQWGSAYMYPRAEIISQIVKKYNAEEIAPWIFDLGCSHGNLPLGLLKSKHEFDYCGVGMNHRIIQKLKDWVGPAWKDRPENQPSILYCTEVLEHCFNPHDVVHTSYKKGIIWDQILLSVPMYCLGGGLPDWKTRRMGHVRNWTPKEFSDFANESWPGYSWSLYKSASMVLHGVKNA